MEYKSLPCKRLSENSWEGSEGAWFVLEHVPISAPQNTVNIGSFGDFAAISVLPIDRVPCPEKTMMDLRLGDCLEILPTIPDASVDAILCDPPYPCISRDYGRMSESAWHAMMRGVVAEARRILKPSGSAVFILQPNSEKVGRMRPWLWEFMAWAAREWNMIQDVWWWNFTSPPTVHCQRDRGLMRPSLKACVWLGNTDCYRDQDRVLWEESERNASNRLSLRCTNRLDHVPSGHHWRNERARSVALERGGVTPFNVLPIPVSLNSSRL